MLAIIGGTGLTTLDGLEEVGDENVLTPFQSEPIKVAMFRRDSSTVAFLPRHGQGHKVPPHKINYRANLWALKQLGVHEIVAVNAVGGIHEKMGPGVFAVPEQLIDYTWGRTGTYFEDDLDEVTHIDFSRPFSDSLRKRLISCAQAIKAQQGSELQLAEFGVYGCTQGPRLETAAEITKLQRDGCDLVGMTAMPEAALARELDLDYAMLALSVNWGAGLSCEEITMAEINKVLAEGMAVMRSILARVIMC
ncbi:MAG: S-methyl-5'-thioinosine phosphorylase [Pseudohongiellaceae bacterium]